MKKIIFYIISLAFIVSTGCNDDSGGSTITDPFGGGGTGGQGGGNNGSVTFQIGKNILQEGYDFDGDGQTDDSFYLTAKPSVDIKINSVEIGIPNDANFDSVQGDGTTIFKASEEVQINSTPYYGVTSGLKFTLKFSGKLSSNDQSFEITVEYIAP